MIIDLDNWQELYSTIKKNKLRTFLTGFAVSWGIFMLIFLLGAGKGLENGVRDQFKGDAVNRIWIGSGETSLPYQGLKPGREIIFQNDDYDYLKTSVSGVDKLAARFNIWRNTNLSYKSNYGAFDIACIHPEYELVEVLEMEQGRFLNRSDLLEFRKNGVIGMAVKDALFKEEDPIGKYMNVAGVPFKIVGVFSDEGGDRDMRRIYIPISTAQRVFNYGNFIGSLNVITNVSAAESEQLEQDIREKLARKHSFDVKDDRALHTWNGLKDFARFMNLMKGIQFFILLIGLMTIVAGIVGVSNIMLIVVKERTKEIGIRKAMGATPNQIIRMILFESILITSFAGYIGLVLGIGLLELIRPYFTSSEFYFMNPEVNLTIAIGATLFLILSGAVAGFIPARRAVSVRPVEALKDE
ncbi:MAG: ABC transporter permease [Bacteroidales bacterium]|nr:ABC transporter permease [Bacteroidales bacterium]MCF8457102.1 ABC transporter permease [Bacteroidales bacterium]